MKKLMTLLFVKIEQNKSGIWGRNIHDLPPGTYLQDKSVVAIFHTGYEVLGRPHAEDYVYAIL